jgi:hypothetical protein
MKNVLKALSEARKKISETEMKKEGKNKYSDYDYFTPNQVHKLVENACQATGLLAKFDLNKNDLGYYGELIVYHIDTTESLSFKLVTDVPDIKATNASQKLGGMMTYTERYLKSSAFGIVDNNLDFDAQDNRPKTEQKLIPQPTKPAATTTAPSNANKPLMTKAQKEAAKAAYAKGDAKGKEAVLAHMKNFTHTEDDLKYVKG